MTQDVVYKDHNAYVKAYRDYSLDLETKKRGLLGFPIVLAITLIVALGIALGAYFAITAGQGWVVCGIILSIFGGTAAGIMALTTVLFAACAFVNPGPKPVYQNQ